MYMKINRLCIVCIHSIHVHRFNPYTGAKTVRQKSTTGAKTEANCITHTHSFPFEIATEPLQIDRQNKKGKCLELNKEYVGVQFIVINKFFIFISILEK